MVFRVRYLPTYRVGQDPTEVFFGNVRRRLGNNDNPSPPEVCYSLRSMSCFTLNVCGNGNCEEQESLLNPVSESRLLQPDVENEEEDIAINEADLEIELDTFSENVVVYIAGFAGKKVTTKLSCNDCACVLKSDDVEAMRMREDYILLLEKDSGGLFKPSEDLIILCKLIEKTIQLEKAKGVFKMKFRQIDDAVKKKCISMNLFSNLHMEFNCKALREVSFEIRSRHKFELISAVCKSYCTTRLHFIAKSSTLSYKPKTIRSRYTKLIQFTGN